MALDLESIHDLSRQERGTIVHTLVDHAPPEMVEPLGQLGDYFLGDSSLTEDVQKHAEPLGVAIEIKCGINIPGVRR